MKKFLVASASFLLPVLAFAQAAAAPQVSAPVTSLTTFLQRLTLVINTIIPFLFGLAVFVVIYGIFGFISSAGDEEARASAKGFIIWGIIGIFLMASVWGLVGILINTFGLSNAGQTTVNRAATQNGLPTITCTIPPCV
ncbi:MAG: hypothetical protein V4467_00610 [Patescibacteria group bacterium]